MGTSCCLQAQKQEDVFQYRVPPLCQMIKLDSIGYDNFVAIWLQKHNQNYKIDKQNLLITVADKSFYRDDTSNKYYFFEEQGTLANGLGFIYEPQKLFFSGYFVEGMADGPALINFIEISCTYQGNVKGWKAHGYGVFIDNEKKYTLNGMWYDSKPISSLMNFYADPNISSIQIINYQQRKCTISYKDKRWYEGEIILQKLMPHGKGTVVFPFDSTTKRYDGDWFLGQMHGIGRIQYVDGSCYVGEFYNGKKTGNGKYFLKNQNQQVIFDKCTAQTKASSK